VVEGAPVKRAALLVLLGGLAAGCGQQAPPVPTTPLVPVTQSFDWPTSTPEAQGIDSPSLERAFQEAAELPFVFSILLVRHGFLVAERYFHGASTAQARSIHSVSKSLTSALVGIALREGYLQSLDQKLLDFFPEHGSADLDPRIGEITLRHLLTMKSGFAWSEDAEDWEGYSGSPDWIAYALNLPLEHPPGEVFSYATPNADLLAAVLAKATGRTTRQFAEATLFEPLGITVGRWDQDSQGHYAGGHDLYVTPRNLARFGYLYLNGGGIGDRQVVPQSWVEESTQPYFVSNVRWGPLEGYGYGYQWWLATLAGRHGFFGLGFGGQYVIVVPTLDLVVVTSTNGDSWERSDPQERAILSLVATSLLPAVR
jgi:CubicO group peptidase (beta-lactamase class C family)